MRRTESARERRRLPAQLAAVKGRRLLLLGVLLAMAFGVVSTAQAQDGERIVITNVRLPGRDSSTQDVPVNLLIIGGELVVVTRDDLVILEADTAVDAGARVVMGQLVLGSRPSFVILEGDPRENFEVLLDTEEYVLFAIRDGVIVKDALPKAAVSPPGSTPKRRAWGGYAPPPMAVPLRYYDSRKWNKFETKFISGLFTGALVLDRQAWLSQNAESEGQVGELEDFEGGKVRGLRAGFVGTLNFKRRWQYVVFVATNTFDKGFDVRTTDEFVLFDYRLDIPLSADLTLSVGKQRQAMSMERLTTLTFLPMQERSAPNDAFLPARTHGAILSGVAGGRFTWAVGAYNNWIDSEESFGNTTSEFTGRATWLPVVSEDESNLLHLGFGLRYSDAKQPLRFGTRPEFNNAPRYADTGQLSADDAMTYNLEAYWRSGPLLVGFEYFGVQVSSTESEDPFFNGYSVTGSWAVTGEMRGYRRRSGLFNPLPVSRPVNRGGWGALELAVRYSRLDLSDGTVDGGELDVLSGGVNWWPTPIVQAGVNYRYIVLDRFGVRGLSSGLNARLQLVLD